MAGDQAGRSPPDAHGQAALILVESLLHVLREQSVLTASATFDVVSTAMEVQEDHATDADDKSEPMWRAHALLASIAASLRVPD